MNEDFLHFIWKFKLFDKHNLQTTDGESVQIISVGLQNNCSGADFTNARIKIGNTEWVGNVEIHLKSSDWIQHKHHMDATYNNVILHVVEQDNARITTKNGNIIPTLILKYDPLLEKRHKQLLTSPIAIPCQPSLKNIDLFLVRHFLSRVLVERLERKSNDIIQTLGNAKNNWHNAFYQLLFRSFGFGTNALPFQMLAKHTPMRIVEKYCDNIFQIEALLFGQAGFLEEVPQDDYQQKLKAEYFFLKTTYNLSPIDKSMWKFGRLHPANFPTIRIAQLSKLVSSMNNIIEQMLNFTLPKELFAVFTADVSKYWEQHYDFGKGSVKQVKPLGKKSIEKLIVNVVAPFLFIYGKQNANNTMQDKALALLDTLPAESNSIIDMWKNAGIKADNAFYSQALIQLKLNYCDKKTCLMCAIGKNIIEKEQLKTF